MVAEKRELEVRGGNVDQAIEAGLVQLDLTRDDVTVEVLDEGSSGFLGIGSRDAIVRLTAKAQIQQPPAMEQKAIQEPLVSKAERQNFTPPVSEPVKAERVDSTPAGEADSAVTEEEGQIALDIVNSLLEKMQVDAETQMSLSEPDDLTGERRWVINVGGNDLGVLIGPRGETLNAFQYVSRLMAGHKLHERPHFIVDIEGYRTRREQALARLAERMAKKVVARGKALSLEPMPPNERRIIHMALRDHNQVFTQSRGEGNRRQVRILLKR